MFFVCESAIGVAQAKYLIFGIKSSEMGSVLVSNVPFWGRNCLSKDPPRIASGLHGPFWGQKATFKTVLGPVLALFHYHYSVLSWPDNHIKGCLQKDHFCEEITRQA
jgi:hypothetical protein